MPGLKLGFVDMTRLFNEYHRTQIEAAKFDANWVKAQEELDRKADHIRELQKQRDEKGDALSEAEKAELEAEFRKAVSEAATKGTDMYAKEHGFISITPLFTSLFERPPRNFLKSLCDDLFQGMQLEKNNIPDKA